MEPGTRVVDQYDGRHGGTVLGPVEGLPGFVYVQWDGDPTRGYPNGDTTEEQIEDVTVVDPSNDPGRLVGAIMSDIYGGPARLNDDTLAL